MSEILTPFSKVWRPHIYHYSQLGSCMDQKNLVPKNFHTSGGFSYICAAKRNHQH